MYLGNEKNIFTRLWKELSSYFASDVWPETTRDLFSKHENWYDYVQDIEIGVHCTPISISLHFHIQFDASTQDFYGYDIQAK